MAPTQPTGKGTAEKSPNNPKMVMIPPTDDLDQLTKTMADAIRTMIGIDTQPALPYQQTTASLRQELLARFQQTLRGPNLQQMFPSLEEQDIFLRTWFVLGNVGEYDLQAGVQQMIQHIQSVQITLSEKNIILVWHTSNDRVFIREYSQELLNILLNSNPEAIAQRISTYIGPAISIAIGLTFRETESVMEETALTSTDKQSTLDGANPAQTTNELLGEWPEEDNAWTDEPWDDYWEDDTTGATWLNDDLPLSPFTSRPSNLSNQAGGRVLLLDDKTPETQLEINSNLSPVEPDSDVYQQKIEELQNNYNAINLKDVVGSPDQPESSDHFFALAREAFELLQELANTNDTQDLHNKTREIDGKWRNLARRDRKLKKDKRLKLVAIVPDPRYNRNVKTIPIFPNSLRSILRELSETRNLPADASYSDKEKNRRATKRLNLIIQAFRQNLLFIENPPQPLQEEDSY